MRNSKNEAFETIYRQHHPMVLQMCLGFVRGDKDTASDLSQEIFISVWNNLDKFRGASSYKTWIYRITVNTCLHYVKKDKKVRRLSSSEIENQTSIIDTEKTINDNIPKLYNAIGQLKRIDRLLIMMVLENQDYDSIAEVIGISPVNVRVKIHRIKKRLEKILKNNKDE
ncbi:sigma-70 family RNA polymerase sigma factor [Bizionia gelidisalsuginis]|uniref:Sigma-70 family RNA polymerase sigma factor n=1 Tax=Bizionia gelidisalsuginis TaxID=291188 RepID=A0ABY3M7G4_9FLAO|nr:sigma-70 family RNA polymerase sigma factor [Bizionia gelidisalsuginis]TYC09131.1 sigma-70 family RNA polymerase sigma factor [Bizionia gelidisalsuginis]